LVPLPKPFSFLFEMDHLIPKELQYVVPHLGRDLMPHVFVQHEPRVDARMLVQCFRRFPADDGRITEELEY